MWYRCDQSGHQSRRNHMTVDFFCQDNRSKINPVQQAISVSGNMEITSILCLTVTINASADRQHHGLEKDLGNEGVWAEDCKGPMVVHLPPIHPGEWISSEPRRSQDNTNMGSCCLFNHTQINRYWG